MMKWYGFVILYNVCVVKCHSIAASEIEDFSNFLKETSQLDSNILKSSPPINEYDEDEIISEHAWEDSGKFEGDLILNERQRRLIVADVAEGLARNGLTDTTKRWPNNEVIYFIQREHFTSDQIEAIQSGIEDLARASCVRFTPYKKGDRDAVVIQGSRRGCFSQVGYQGGYQVLNLSGRHPVGRGCFRHGTVVHEMLHTLGFYHMQSSPDRDEFIDVVWENILRPARHNFRKYNSFSVSDFGVGYDYESVLHYSRKAFSSNGQDTLVPKQGGARIGQRVGLSQKDIQKLNKMYCDADSDLQDENSDQPKKLTPKKKAKNSPFEGHGIGYQKGKTVIIQLPKTGEKKVTHSPRTFDYFSRPPVPAPTAVQGFGIGKEISYNYHPLTTVPREEIKSVIVQDNSANNPEMGRVYSTGSIEGTTEDDDLNEAFHRLSQIVGPQVLPTETTKFDYDYSEFLNPTSNDRGQIRKENEGDFTERFAPRESPKQFVTREQSNLQHSSVPKSFSEQLVLNNYNEGQALRLIDQQNHDEREPIKSEPIIGFVPEEHNYSHVYDTSTPIKIKNYVSPLASFEKDMDRKKHTFLDYNYSAEKLSDKEPYTVFGSFDSSTRKWRNNDNPTHESYRNRYPDSQDYR